MLVRIVVAFLLVCVWTGSGRLAAERPNILIAIADDQSYPHCSAYGYEAISTPAFDRVAKSGVLFHNAFTPAPGCSPMRAAFLTGREIWQIGAAGTHASYFPTDLPVFTNQLAAAGYHVGMTGKGWGPGSAKGWEHNPAGKLYAKRKLNAPDGIANTDYAGNFTDFLADRQPEKPFCFWFGSKEPHRVYQPGIGAANGVDIDKVVVPAFLPDSPQVRSDIADYLYEIQWFDSQLMRMLEELDQLGQLENTMVIVTSDNGMPFPRAKANLYEYGIHMPLAIGWPNRIGPGQESRDLVSLLDVTRTIFDAAQVEPQQADQLAGESLLPSFRVDVATGDVASGDVASGDVASGGTAGRGRTAVFSGRERHSSSRYNTLGYPCRSIRTKTHLYIRNFAPQRWPAGAPQKYDQAEYDADGALVNSRLGSPHGGYHDIDDGPTLQWMIANRANGAGPLLAAAVDRRPAEELYDVVTDPGCLNNLAQEASAQSIKATMSAQLEAYLTETDDLRQTDPRAADVWETYPRVSSLRWFPIPDWVSSDRGAVPAQSWLEQRRPRAR